ncbi:MAG: hypothetical protein ABEJ02_02645 [Candidatus Paceibacteria bacterium]
MYSKPDIYFKTTGGPDDEYKVPTPESLEGGEEAEKDAESGGNIEDRQAEALEDARLEIEEVRNVLEDLRGTAEESERVGEEELDKLDDLKDAAEGVRDRAELAQRFQEADAEERREIYKKIYQNVKDHSKIRNELGQTVELLIPPPETLGSNEVSDKTEKDEWEGVSGETTVETFDEEETIKRLATLYDEKIDQEERVEELSDQKQEKTKDKKELNFKAEKQKLKQLEGKIEGLINELTEHTDKSTDEVAEEIAEYSDELEDTSETEEDEKSAEERDKTLDLPRSIMREAMVNQGESEKIVDALVEGNPDQARNIVENLFDNLSQDQLQRLEEALEGQGWELEEFLEKWEDELAGDVVEMYQQEINDRVQKKVQEQMTWTDKLRAGWKSAAKKVGAYGGSMFAGASAGAAAGSLLGPIGSIVGGVVGARFAKGGVDTVAEKSGVLEEGEDTKKEREESEMYLAEVKGYSDEAKEEIKSEMKIDIDEERQRILADTINQKLSKAPEKTRLDEWKNKILDVRAEELEEEDLEEEAINKKLEVLEHKLDKLIEAELRDGKTLVEAAVENGANKQAVEVLAEENAGDLPEDLKDSDVEKHLQRFGVPTTAGASAMAAAAAGGPVAGYMAYGGGKGGELGMRYGEKFDKDKVSEEMAERIEAVQSEVMERMDRYNTEEEIKSTSTEKLSDDLAKIKGALDKGIIDQEVVDAFDTIGEERGAGIKERVQQLEKEINRELNGRKLEDLDDHFKQIEAKSEISGQEDVEYILPDEEKKKRKYLGAVMGAAAGVVAGNLLGDYGGSSEQPTEQEKVPEEAQRTIGAEDVHEGGASYPGSGPASAKGEVPAVDLEAAEETSEIRMDPTEIEGAPPIDVAWEVKDPNGVIDGIKGIVEGKISLEDMDADTVTEFLENNDDLRDQYVEGLNEISEKHNIEIEDMKGVGVEDGDFVHREMQTQEIMDVFASVKSNPEEYPEFTKFLEELDSQTSGSPTTQPSATAEPTPGSSTGSEASTAGSTGGGAETTAQADETAAEPTTEDGAGYTSPEGPASMPSEVPEDTVEPSGGDTGEAAGYTSTEGTASMPEEITGSEAGESGKELAEEAERSAEGGAETEEAVLEEEGVPKEAQSSAQEGDTRGVTEGPPPSVDESAIDVVGDDKAAEAGGETIEADSETTEAGTESASESGGGGVSSASEENLAAEGEAGEAEDGDSSEAEEAEAAAETTKEITKEIGGREVNFIVEDGKLSMIDDPDHGQIFLDQEGDINISTLMAEETGKPAMEDLDWLENYNEIYEERGLSGPGGAQEFQSFATKVNTLKEAYHALIESNLDVDASDITQKVNSALESHLKQAEEMYGLEVDRSEFIPEEPKT